MLLHIHPLHKMHILISLTLETKQNMHLQLFLQMEKFQQVFFNILKHFVNHINTSSNIVGPNAAFVPICYKES